MDNDEILKILVASDIHLGYAEKDPLRHDDSFNTFEEILQIAQKNNVDFLLLGGDLFHENKPSRSCLNKCIKLLRSYCLNYSDRDPPCANLRIISDNQIFGANYHASMFENNTIAHYNYLDPNLNITLPVFSVHGNHDDPSGRDNLSAIDLLASAGLINHFGSIYESAHYKFLNTNIANTEKNGRQITTQAPTQLSNLEKIVIRPLFFQKGNTKVALYGLGSIRDERLHRLFLNKNVTFLKPPTSPSFQPNEKNVENINGPTIHNMNKENENGVLDNTLNHTHNLAEEFNDINDSEYFNLFVIHQNRVKHGPTNYIPEYFLDEFLDLVIWGHEHECLIDPEWNAEKGFFVSQPGSSIATSLSVGEAVPKHVGLLQIKQKSFKMTKIPLQTVRPFVLLDLDLKNDAKHIFDRIPHTSKNFSKAIINYLNDKVCSMIEKDVTQQIKDHIKQPHKPLIRIRIEYDEKLEFLNPIKFGQSFVDTVANPKDIIHFYKKPSENESLKEEKNALKKFLSHTNPMLLANGASLETDAIITVSGVEELVKNFLEKADNINQLSILSEKGLGLAIRQYIDKQENDAICELVNYQLNRIQSDLENKETVKDEDTVDQEIVKFKENRLIKQLTQEERGKMIKPLLNMVSQSTLSTTTSPGPKFGTKTNKKPHKKSNKPDELFESEHNVELENDFLFDDPRQIPNGMDDDEALNDIVLEKENQRPNHDIISKPNPVANNNTNRSKRNLADTSFEKMDLLNNFPSRQQKQSNMTNFLSHSPSNERIDHNVKLNTEEINATDFTLKTTTNQSNMSPSSSSLFSETLSPKHTDPNKNKTQAAPIYDTSDDLVSTSEEDEHLLPKRPVRKTSSKPAVSSKQKLGNNEKGLKKKTVLTSNTTNKNLNSSSQQLSFISDGAPKQKNSKINIGNQTSTRLKQGNSTTESYKIKPPQKKKFKI